jgi:hypothetical protein
MKNNNDSNSNFSYLKTNSPFSSSPPKKLFSNSYEFISPLKSPTQNSFSEFNQSPSNYSPQKH